MITMRRVIRVAVLLVVLAAGASTAAVIVSQTAWFRSRLLGYVVRQANQSLLATLSVGQLDGNLFDGVELHNVRLRLDDADVATVDTIRVDYNLRQVISNGLSLDRIHIVRPVVFLRRTSDGWNVSRLVKPSETPASSSSRTIAVADVTIDNGSLVVEGAETPASVKLPPHVDEVNVKLAVTHLGDRTAVHLAHLSAHANEPTLSLDELSGDAIVDRDALTLDRITVRTSHSALSIAGGVHRLQTDPELQLRVSSSGLSLPEIARLVPSLEHVDLRPSFTLALNGPLNRLGIDTDVQSPAGQITTRVTANVKDKTQSIAGDLSVRHLDLAPILNDTSQKSDITADARVNLRSDALSDLNALRGDVSVSSPKTAAAGYEAGPIDLSARVTGRQLDMKTRASAYGVDATAEGRIMLPESNGPSTAQTIVFDLNGHVGNLDPRKLPKSLAVPSLDAVVNAALQASGRAVPSDWKRAEVTARATFEPSLVAGAVIGDRSTVMATQHDGVVSYDADVQVSRLNLRRLGEEAGISALASEQYESSITGHVVGNGRGVEWPHIDANLHGTLSESSITGVEVPRADFEASLLNDVVHGKVNSTFMHVNPGVLSGNASIDGDTGGDAQVDVTIPNISNGVVVENMTGTMSAQLAPSKIAGFELTSTTVDGELRDGAVNVRSLDLAAHDVTARASGTLAIDRRGQSDLKVHAESADLAKVTSTFGPRVTGSATVDATVTGNRDELKVSGSALANQVKYDDNGALEATSEFTASIKDFDRESAVVSATTRATFVTVAGQSLDEVVAKTDYRASELAFDATAKQPERSVTLAATATFGAESQDVRITNIDLQSRGSRWRIAPGTTPVVHRAGDVISVEALRLVSGTNNEQHVTANGSFGRPEDTLTVTLNDVDVSAADAFLLREPEVSGRLSGTARVSGTTAKPIVDGDFAIAKGGFRKFAYESLGGTARYADNGVDVDARLQQDASTWAVAKGYVPLADRAPRKEYALHVESSAIDAGVVQGFVPTVTDVRGTLQATVDVTGAASDPKPQGVVTIANGAFTVKPTGVTYSQLDGRIDLQPQRVHIDQLSVLDNHKRPMTVTGDLALREREVGGVSIQIKSDGFQIIDNKLGNLRINSDLRIAGELTAPRIDGELGVSTGQINLDQVLALLGDNAYSTQETTFVSDANRQSGGSAFDPVQMYVHLTVPNDLVVKASDIQTGDTPIGLGALNVTLGGDLYASKSPWDQLRLLGTVNTVRGTYDFQSRRFTILRDGTVRFDGSDDNDAALDIRAERVIQAVTANVNVRGRLSRPEIALSSTPPLAEADILALIVFNQPVNQLGTGQQASLVSTAQSMALGAATGALAQSLGSMLNLDTFELNMSPDSGGPPQVTVGQQLGQNLYVRIQQGIGNQSQTNLILEYELTKWLRFRTNMLQGASPQSQLFQRMQGSGVDLLFFFSY